MAKRPPGTILTEKQWQAKIDKLEARIKGLHSEIRHEIQARKQWQEQCYDLEARNAVLQMKLEELEEQQKAKIPRWGV